MAGVLGGKPGNGGHAWSRISSPVADRSTGRRETAERVPADAVAGYP